MAPGTEVRRLDGRWKIHYAAGLTLRQQIGGEVMHAIKKASLALVTAAVATLALGAASAQAQTVWTPPNEIASLVSTTIIELSSGQSIVCPNSEMVINTRDDGMGGPTPNGTIDSMTLPAATCTSSTGNVVDIVVGCFPWPLVAIDEVPNSSGSGIAHITIPPGCFTVTIDALGVECEFEVSAQGMKAYWEDAAAHVLTFGNDIPPAGGGPDPNNVFVDVSGSFLCPSDQPGTWSGAYAAVSPTPIEIND